MRHKGNQQELKEVTERNMVFCLRGFQRSPLPAVALLGRDEQDDDDEGRSDRGEESYIKATIMLLSPPLHYYEQSTDTCVQKLLID